MRMKKLVAAVIVAALTVSPTMTVAQTTANAAASLSIAPANETVEGSQLRGGFIIPLIALIAIILGILAATHNDDGDLPHSP